MSNITEGGARRPSAPTAALAVAVLSTAALALASCSASRSFAPRDPGRDSLTGSRGQASIQEDMARYRPASLVAPVARGAGAPEQWASLDDPYGTSYSQDGAQGYPDGAQLIDPANAVAGLPRHLSTGRAGERLLNGGGRTVAAGQRLKPSELRTAVYTDTAPASPRAAKAAGKGATPRLLTAAYSMSGRPYRPGQSAPQSGFDNAGLVGYAYSQAGVRLPKGRTAQDLVAAGQPVTKDDLRPGDMLVYNDPKSPGNYLLGLYSGNGNIILASPRLKVVTETAAFGTDYGPYFVGGRRLYDDPAATPLSEDDRMAVTNGAVKAALSNLGEIPRIQPVSSPTSGKSKSSYSKGKRKGKVSSKSGSGRKASAKAKPRAKSKAKSRRVVKRRG
jgi:cell wall-associated NlpC family hydrolase